MPGNLENVRAVLEAWNRRDMATVARYLHPDFEWIEHDQNPTPVVPVTGVGAIEEVTAGLEEELDDYRAEIVNLVETGPDVVVAVLRESGRGATSGAPFTTEFGYVISLRDGRATRIEAYRDPGDAFAAVEAPSD